MKFMTVLIRVLLLAVPLAACQPMSFGPAIQSEVVDELLAGEGILKPPLSPAAIRQMLPDDRPFELTPELKALANRVAPPGDSANYKVRELVRMLLSPTGAHLKYNGVRTYTAAESFRLSEANCLSFTMLFVALADEVGLEVYLNEVDVPPIWDVQGDERLLYYRHVNAVVELPLSFRKVVDINMTEYDVKYPQRKISRAHAEAMYYNNRGSELMYEKQYQRAFLYFRKALTLQPQAGYIWGNLASLYRRVGRNDLAEAGYRHALHQDGFDPVAAGNLARVLRAAGKEAEAVRMDESVASFRARNPYYHYSLASHDYRNGRYLAASDHLDRAMNLYRKDHRFYQLRAMLDFQAGDLASARMDLEKAAEYAYDDKLKARYLYKLDRLSQCDKCRE